MNLDISKHGDILELTYVQLLNQRLPSYIEIWIRLIGNDGTGKLVEVPGLEQAAKVKREIFSQYHYSSFESVVGMKTIIEKIDTNSIETVQGYIQANNEFLAFQAHAGRIHDCVKKMGELFYRRDLERGLYDYNQQRNEVLHGCKIPFMIIEGALAIPAIMGGSSDPNKWHSKKSWNEVKPDDLNFLSKYLAESFKGITERLNKALYSLLPVVIEFTNQHKIQLDASDYRACNNDTAQRANIIDNHFFVTYNTSASVSMAFTTK